VPLLALLRDGFRRGGAEGVGLGFEPVQGSDRRTLQLVVGEGDSRAVLGTADRLGSRARLPKLSGPPDPCRNSPQSDRHWAFPAYLLARQLLIDWAATTALRGSWRRFGSLILLTLTTVQL